MIQRFKIRVLNICALMNCNLNMNIEVALGKVFPEDLLETRKTTKRIDK
jgi:hypothetical protein